MADADQQDNTSQSTDNQAGATGSKADAQLAEVRSMLENMNKQFSDGLQAIASAVRPAPAPVPQDDIDDDDVYQPKKLTQKVLRRTDEVVNQALAREREMNAMVYTLAQEYPEIQTSPEVRKAVLDAHNTIPQAMRDTAAGYEMAVLKATSKAGIVPKSRRPVVDPDVSLGAGRSTSERTPKGKQKVTDDVKMIAQLFGRDINDKNVIKGLEDAINRDSYSKYR